jgi:Glyoxalase-like domain
VGSPTRLRQVALVAAELGPVADRLQSELGLGAPFRDPGVGAFGLENAVFSVGDTFIEVVAPIEPDTAGGRYLAKHGGDGGYMAIFQVPDLTEARRRVADLGIRVVWTSDYPDIGGTHLHPKDVPGAIVSLDWAEPPDTWRWAGPAWTGRAPDVPPGGVRGLTVDSSEPAALARRWGSVLGIEPDIEGGGASIGLDAGGQVIRFAAAEAGRDARISEVTVALPESTGAAAAIDIGGVRFVLTGE